jgi:hypothetical protein
MSTTAPQPALRAPFPWFGGKSRAADLVWSRFGDVPNFVEPFFGSGAVMLMRPHEPRCETINDLDCYVANFWRAIQADPEVVCHHADWPINEADLHARHQWLVNRAEFRERMKSEPDHFDAKIAGWWVWGICQWIGGGWCRLNDDGEARLDRTRPQLTGGNGVNRRRPNNKERGVHRKRVLIAKGGIGINSEARNPWKKRSDLKRGWGRGVHARLPQQMPSLGGDGSGSGRGILRWGVEEEGGLLDWFLALAARLRRVRVCCGNWDRILGPSPTVKIGLTGVFLDPPYSGDAERDPEIYAQEDLEVAHAVREWAIQHGNDPLLRIALCGYEGEHAMPDGWECVAWKPVGGYGNQQQNGRGRSNAGRERIWFSPGCLTGEQKELFT